MLSFRRASTRRQSPRTEYLFKETTVMESRTVALSDVDDDDLARWVELAERAIEPNVFLDPRILAPGGQINEAARDKRFLLVEESGMLHGVMAYEVDSHRIMRLSFKAVALGSFPYTSRRFPLIAPEKPVETMTELLRAVRSLRLASLFDLENFPADGPLHDALFAAAAALRIRTHTVESLAFAYAYRDDPETETEPAGAVTGAPAALEAERPVRLRMDKLGTTVRKHHGKYFRGLERHTGAALTFSDRAADPSAIIEFLDLQAAGWKGDVARGGGAFRVTGWDPWFIQTTDAFRAAGQLAVYTVSSASGTVYMQVAVRSGAALFGMQDAYDESYSEFRPGNLGRLAVIEHSLAESTAAWFDPNIRPWYVDSTRLYPDRRQYAHYVLPMSGLVASSALSLRPLVRRLRERMRRN
jgi:hypothetical protein